jgi:putative acetyltransferase
MSETTIGAFTFRPVRATDVPAVLDHVRQTLAEFGLTFGVGAKSDNELRHLPQSYEDHGGAFWIAETTDAKRLVGTVGVMPVEPGIFELRKMYLLPETRGKGVGVALLNRAMAHAHAHGARKIVLDTVEEMRDAIAFYERHGFVRNDRWISAPRCSRGYELELPSA